MNAWKPKASHTVRTILWMLLDAVLVNTAMIVAQQLRFDVNVPAEFFARYINIAFMMTGLCLLSFWAFGLYRTLWEYASVGAAIQVALASLAGAAGTYAYSLIRYAMTQPVNHHLLHRTVYLLFWILLVILIGASRLLLRVLATRERLSLRKGGGEPLRRVMVVGAGWAGANVIHEMQNGRYENCVPIVAVDDDPARAGAKLKGVPVVSGTGNILKLASDYQIDEIVIAIATPHGEMKLLVEKCLSTGCRVRRVASLQEVSGATTAPSVIRDINVNDLLGRPEEQMDMTQVEACFRGKVVLITGGGGSIGGELCRQLIAFAPEKIVLYDISENYMYDLFFQLQEQYRKPLKDTLLLRVGSIQDPGRLDEVMGEFKPDIVIHAAAHKHVPLMEESPSQAVKNNVFGTHWVARAAVTHGVKRFVLISTDKAVNPTNVMGATKRLAEMIIEALNQESGTEFMAVRFGNVLGSHGSVVPLFERQIRSGGPITLTHPEIIRYFMTIPEAAGLVLQAASIAKGGELFVLDMGQPMKIRELAERMIQLYAVPGSPKVKIVYTGLRPGEKLYEELLMEDEGIARTEKEKIFIARPEVISMEMVQSILAKLEGCIHAGENMKDCLHGILPSYMEADEVNRRAEQEHRLDQTKPVESHP